MLKLDMLTPMISGHMCYNNSSCLWEEEDLGETHGDNLETRLEGAGGMLGQEDDMRGLSSALWGDPEHIIQEAPSVWVWGISIGGSDWKQPQNSPAVARKINRWHSLD